jgi:hypothetical protein
MRGRNTLVKRSRLMKKNDVFDRKDVGYSRQNGKEREVWKKGNDCTAKLLLVSILRCLIKT